MSQHKSNAAAQMKDALQKVKEHPTIPVWPDYGVLAGIKDRCGAYTSIKRDGIDHIKHGRLIRVLSSPLRKRLKID